MIVNMIVKLEWDKSKESLVEFRRKYDNLKRHLEALQVRGHLPRNEIKYSITTRRGAEVSGHQYHQSCPTPSHMAGTPLSDGRLM